MSLFNNISDAFDRARRATEEAFNNARRVAEEVQRKVEEAAHRAAEVARDLERKLEEARRKAEELAREVAREAQRLMEEAKRKAEELAREIERKALEAKRKVEQLADEASNKIHSTVTGVQEEMEKLVPDFEEKLKEVMDEIAELASQSAKDGVDITDAVSSANDTALKKAEEALKKAIDDITALLERIKNTLLGLLDKLPDIFCFIKVGVKKIADLAFDGLKAFAEKIKQGVGVIREKLAKWCAGLVKKVGEVLGPIWSIIKRILKAFFGEEPEHVQICAEWFDERMQRTEKELLLDNQTSLLVKRRALCDLLPANDGGWKGLIVDFLDAQANLEILAQLETLELKPGRASQISLSINRVDSLGGHQRVHIAILCYRWKTDDFLSISSGFLGVLTLTCAAGTAKPENAKTPSIRRSRTEIPAHDAELVKLMQERQAATLRRIQGMRKAD